MWDRVEQLLREQDLSIADLSRMTGIGKSTFSGWKNQKYQPKSDKRQKVADALGVSILYLDGLTDERSLTNSTAEPIYDVAAGQGRINDGDYTDKFMENEENMDGYGWCQVCGDSMSPTLLDGDYVRIEYTTETQPTDLTAIRIDGESCTIKHVEVVDNGIWVRAINKDVYEDRFYTMKEVLSLPISIIGKVVELKRKF